MTDLGFFLIAAGIFVNFIAVFIDKKPMGIKRATMYFGSGVTILVGFALVYFGIGG